MTSTLNSCEKAEPLIIPLEIKVVQGLLKNSRTFRALKKTFQNLRIFKVVKDLCEPIHRNIAGNGVFSE